MFARAYICICVRIMHTKVPAKAMISLMEIDIESAERFNLKKELTFETNL